MIAARPCVHICLQSDLLTACSMLPECGCSPGLHARMHAVLPRRTEQPHELHPAPHTNVKFTR